MLDELRIASDHFQAALDQYVNACLAVKKLFTNAALPSCSPNPLGSMLMNELSAICAHEDKIRQSRLAIIYSINQSCDVVPVSKLPTDILIHIFQLLIETEHGLPYVNTQAIPEYPLRLSHVCSRWRSIVLESPYLWSCIRINSHIEDDEKLLAYTNFHTTRAGRALMDACIADAFSTVPNILGLLKFVKPFIHRLRSLEVQMTMQAHSGRISKIQDHLLTECLKASTNTLKRLAIITCFTDTPSSSHSSWFIESTSSRTTHNSLGLELPPMLLEDVLHSVSELWLEGLYFNWTSKAYHGLTSLRLECSDHCSIFESQLMAIIASSPRLQWIDIGLEVIRDVVSPNLIYLSHLKVLVDTQDIQLLRLIQPGSNELTFSVPAYIHPTSDVIYGTLLKDFFSRANVTTFYSEGFLRNTSDICYLLSVATGIRVLGLSTFKLSGTLTEAPPGSQAFLDELVLDLSGECEVEWPTLRRMIEIYGVKKLQLWVHPDERDEQVKWKWDEQTARKELSNLGDVLIQFISESDYHPVSERFLGPIT